VNAVVISRATIINGNVIGGGGGIHRSGDATAPQDSIVAHNGVTYRVGTVTSNSHNADRGTT